MEDAAALIQRLGLRPHPEGGHYRETLRVAAADGGRSPLTLIYFLLQAGEVSHWHRVDATEVWHWHAGAPLALSVAAAGAASVTQLLGNDLAAGQEPQRVVPKDAWQSARSLGDWTLCGCSVAPGFDFAGFELAPPGWTPPG